MPGWTAHQTGRGTTTIKKWRLRNSEFPNKVSYFHFHNNYQLFKEDLEWMNK